MSAITIEDDLVHYEVLGRGKPIILLHGWLGSWRYWVPTMQQMAFKYRCYAVDLWGFGDSAKDPSRYTMERQASLIANFMDRMGIPRVVLVGHGLGAVVAAYFAASHLYSSRVHRMLVIAPPLFESAPGSVKMPQALTYNTASTPRLTPGHLPPPLTDEQLKQPPAAIVPSEHEAKDRLSQIHKADTLTSNPLREIFANTSLEDLLKKAVAPNSQDYEKLKGEIVKSDQRAVNASIDALNYINPLRDILSTNAATCALIGGNDGLLPHPDDHILDQLDERQALKLLVMGNAYHFPMLEDNAQFVRLLKEFLEAPDLSSLEMKEEWRRRKR